jgi:DNA helicase-2/ATP-dependent DNA helicase PcrA
LNRITLERDLPLYEGIRALVDEGTSPSAMQKRLEAFLTMMDDLRDRHPTLRGLAQKVLETTDYLGHLRAEGTEEAMSRIENIQELVSVIAEYENNRAVEDKSLEGFLDRVALVSDVDNYHDRWNRVSLMTLHCAKGLEFPVVFLTGMEEGLFPHHRRGEDTDEIEEERRLCYVGMTRAKRKLYLVHVENRTIFGAQRVCRPSRFLKEIPEDLIERGASPHATPRQQREEPLQQTTETVYDTTFDGFEEIPSLRIGQRVRHPKFGEGTIQYCEGEREKQRIIAYFPSVGTKTLSLRFARLEIIQEP